MTLNSGQTIAGNADPVSGGFIEATTTGYGFTPPDATTEAAVAVSGSAAAPGGVKVAYVLIMLIVGLAILKFLSEHEKADLEVAHVRISVWNWFAITLLAVAGIVTGKALFNIWPGSASPVTRLFNAA